MRQRIGVQRLASRANNNAWRWLGGRGGDGRPPHLVDGSGRIALIRKILTICGLDW